jgi:hypothetical protein
MYSIITFIANCFRALGRLREPKGTMLDITPTMRSFIPKAESLYDRGYNYAKVQLEKRGDAAIRSIEGFIECETNFGRYGDFERGAREAIVEYVIANSSYLE